MNEIREFVTAYIQREYTIPDDVDIMGLNYVDSGYIDSMGFVQFIATIEDEFDIEFDVEDIENPEIKVVGKLIQMIEQKLNSL